MLISGIVCTYSTDNYHNLLEAVNSLINQTYQKLEIIIVVDNNEQLRKRIATTYATQGNIQVLELKESMGVSEARNTGIRKAQGDIIAFLDDDAVAEKRWIKRLVDTYQKTGALAVSGKILPIWLPKEPVYLPEELYWLVGLTYKGYAPEGITEVRNALGPNMSFRREVFEKVGLFSKAFAFTGKRGSLIQGEEAELALRIKVKLGKGVIYNPKLIVYHKVPASKTRLGILLKRSFYQGYSKARLRRLSPAAKPLAAEASYLKDVLFKYTPGRLKKVFLMSHPVTEIKQLLILFSSVLAIGLGFIFGYFQRLHRYSVSSPTQFPP